MGNAFPAQYPVGGVGLYHTPPILLPQTNTKVLFTAVSLARQSVGWIEIHDLSGIITTTIGAVANATKIKAKVLTPAGLAFVDLCATADINALTAGTVLGITGTLATALQSNANGVILSEASKIKIGFVGNLEIRVDCAGSDGLVGKVSWVLAARNSYGVSIKPIQS